MLYKKSVYAPSLLVIYVVQCKKPVGYEVVNVTCGCNETIILMGRTRARVPKHNKHSKAIKLGLARKKKIILSSKTCWSAMIDLPLFRASQYIEHVFNINCV